MLPEIGVVETTRVQRVYRVISLLLIVITMLMAGCASTSGVVSESDPYENINRKIYGFNSTFDDHVASPIAKGYKFITPDPVESGVSNFFENLSNINVVLNDVLQGKFKQGFRDTGRFAINSTVGLVGLFDVAEKIGLEQNNEDFGQTLAVWGVGSGPYLVLPFLGPTTLRGTPSYAVEALTNPLISAFPPLLGLDMVDTRARAEGAIQFVNESALDPYLFTRESFLQWRQFLIYDSNPPIPDLEVDIEDALFEEEFDEEMEEAGQFANEFDSDIENDISETPESNLERPLLGSY